MGRLRSVGGMGAILLLCAGAGETCSPGKKTGLGNAFLVGSFR